MRSAFSLADGAKVTNGRFYGRFVSGTITTSRKGALYRSMNADVLRETLDKRLWGLFIELVCAVSEILGIDADELIERMLTNPKAEAMIMALYSSVMGKDD